MVGDVLSGIALFGIGLGVGWMVHAWSTRKVVRAFSLSIVAQNRGAAVWAYNRVLENVERMRDAAVAELKDAAAETLEDRFDDEPPSGTT